MAVTTGLRRGEICGLRWTDIDLENSTMTVRRSASDADGLVDIKDTRTHAARRLALDPITVQILRDHRERVDRRAAASLVEIKAQRRRVRRARMVGQGASSVG